MRILYFGNNRLGWKVAHWLREQGENLVGLVIHPMQKGKFVDEIRTVFGKNNPRIFDGSQLGKPETLSAIRELRPDIGVSVLFGFIIRKELLDIFQDGCINLHPALLPYNRGAYPNVWAIVDHTPAGVTLHYMDEGLDTGDIIDQRRIDVEPVDTGGSLYQKLERCSFELFKDTWPLIRSRKAPRTPQERSEGSYHKTTDIERIDEIDLDRPYVARQLLDVLRARTFPPYRGAYFWSKGRRVFLRVHLEYDETT